MKNDEIDEVISQKVDARLNELKSCSAEELRELPFYTPEKFEVGGKPQELGVYRDSKENGETLIVVQCKNTRFLGFGYMFAEGFVINSVGQFCEAEEELMYEYR
jgi:hypothetical protein